MAVNSPKPIPFAVRVIPLGLALFVGWLLTLGVMRMWNDYWVLQDSQRGTARILGPNWRGRGSLTYQYTVGQENYKGWSSPNREDPQNVRSNPGDDSIVYYSASHPWLSSLARPTAVYTGGPSIFIHLGLEIFAIAALIRPRIVYNPP